MHTYALPPNLEIHKVVPHCNPVRPSVLVENSTTRVVSKMVHQQMKFHLPGKYSSTMEGSGLYLP